MTRERESRLPAISPSSAPSLASLQQLGSEMVAVGGFLLCNALVLVLVRRMSGTGDEEHLSLRHAFFLGWVQVLAILPGISRSGFTLAAGLRVGLVAMRINRGAIDGGWAPL